MSEKIFNRIHALLSEQNAKFRVVEHGPARTSEEVAKLRGTELGQGAKALVCTIKGVENLGKKLHVVAILPADMKADLDAVAKAFGGTRASLASPSETSELTDCVFGSVPPFSFHSDLTLIADPSLLTRYEELAFNAGLLDRSIILNTKDYERIVSPKLVKFATA